MAEREVEFLTPDGTQISGLFWGADSDTAVVLIHGFLSSKDNPLFFDLVKTLHPSYATLRIDLRGCGKSEDAAINFDQVQDVHTAIEYCLHEQYSKVVVFGHSLGGLYVMMVSHPAIIARVGLAASTAAPTHNWPMFTPEEKADLLSGKDVKKAVESRSRDSYLISSSYIAQRESVDQGELFISISEPVLLVHGGDDGVVKPEVSISAAPLLPAGSDVEVIRSANHWFVEHEQDVCSKVTAWLDQLA